jgi:hypothetical protein
MDQLHAIVDGAVDYFERYPDIRRMLRQVRETDTTIPSVIVQYASDRVEDFTQAVTVMLSVIEDGQATGAVRDGDPSALLHFFMTLVYEHVFLATPDSAAPALTHDQFHSLVDGALRRPAS